MPASYSDESSLDEDSLTESRPYNRKELERKLSTFDDQFGSNESSQVMTAMTASSTTNNSAGLNESNDSLYFDGEEEKKQTKKQTKKADFNQGGALEVLMTPARKKKSSVAATLVLPKSLAKSKKSSDTNLSSKVTNTLDRLGSGESKKKSSRQSGKSPKASKEKANVDEMWDLLGKGSGHGKHRRSTSNVVPELTDECGFILEPGSPEAEALSSSSHRNNNSGEIGRSSRRGGRRNGGQGSSTHQKASPTDPQLVMSPAARKRGASRRRRDMDKSSSHRDQPGGDRLRSSSQGRGDRTAQTPGTPRQRNRSMGKVRSSGAPNLETQSAHLSNETPVRRRMRRRGSAGMGPNIDMPFNSPENGSKEAVNAADFLSTAKGVMSPVEGGAEGGKRPMRGRRPSQRMGDELKSPSEHGEARPRRNGSIRSTTGNGPPPQRNSSIRSKNGGRRRRSRDPALVNAGVPTIE